MMPIRVSAVDEGRNAVLLERRHKRIVMRLRSINLRNNREETVSVWEFSLAEAAGISQAIDMLVSLTVETPNG